MEKYYLSLIKLISNIDFDSFDSSNVFCQLFLRLKRPQKCALTFQELFSMFYLQLRVFRKRSTNELQQFGGGLAKLDNFSVDIYISIYFSIYICGWTVAVSSLTTAAQCVFVCCPMDKVTLKTWQQQQQIHPALPHLVDRFVFFCFLCNFAHHHHHPPPPTWPHSPRTICERPPNVTQFNFSVSCGVCFFF